MTAKGAALIGGIVGFIAGAVACYFYMKNGEETEVIDFVPEREKAKKDENKSEPFDEAYYTTHDATVEYAKRTSRSSYSQKYNETVELEKDMLEAKKDKPYVISPEEFGEIPGYSRFTLKYFKDGFLIDDQNQPIDDVETVVGKDFMNHFGEYEDDTVYIRNDRVESDFEILFVDEEYMDVLEER